jgi:hypothetical protein
MVAMKSALRGGLVEQKVKESLPAALACVYEQSSAAGKCGQILQVSVSERWPKSIT